MQKAALILFLEIRALGVACQEWGERKRGGGEPASHCMAGKAPYQVLEIILGTHSLLFSVGAWQGDG